MFKDYSRSLSLMRTFMVAINFIIVLFYASVILLGTKYVVKNHLSRTFLDELSYLPKNPVYIFFGTIFLFIILSFIIYNHPSIIKNNYHFNIIYSFIELAVCFLIIYFLYMGYNGIILLVFSDTVYRIQKDKSLKWLIVALVIIYFIASYDVFSNVLQMPSVLQYFQVFDSTVKGSLSITKNLLETLNIVIFIIFMISYLVSQIQEKESIEKELYMINQVNRELKNYAAVTEKIGENNERKRLAREIHDTLGHALTGIAAGVDACIAMIDINPEATKQQLQVVSKVVRQGIGDVRNSLNKLRPGALEKHGLKVAIEKMIEEFSSVSDLTINFHYELEKVDFENTKEDILFRIIQESITNALRHGGATIIDISMTIVNDEVCLIIHDNGVGCTDIKYGYGLKQMKERIAIINGKVKFNGEDGFLTEVTIPLQEGEVYD